MGGSLHTMVQGKKQCLMTVFLPSRMPLVPTTLEDEHFFPLSEHTPFSSSALCPQTQGCASVSFAQMVSPSLVKLQQI